MGTADVLREAARHVVRLSPASPMMKRVMIVDDNEDERTTIAETLREEGYEVFEAPSGREALEMLGRIDPNVMLLDLVMPAMSGEEVLDALRRSGRLDTLRVVVLTGLERDIDVPGAWLVLPKPVSLHQLVSQLEHIAPPA
jgi:CheY-like chemotaxis protein